MKSEYSTSKMKSFDSLHYMKNLVNLLSAPPTPGDSHPRAGHRGRSLGEWLRGRGGGDACAQPVQPLGRGPPGRRDGADCDHQRGRGEPRRGDGGQDGSKPTLCSTDVSRAGLTSKLPVAHSRVLFPWAGCPLAYSDRLILRAIASAIAAKPATSKLCARHSSCRSPRSV